MSYGLNRVEPSRRVAVYVDRILKGAQPADLPCRATKFELAVWGGNTRSAPPCPSGIACRASTTVRSLTSSILLNAARS